MHKCVIWNGRMELPCSQYGIKTWNISTFKTNSQACAFINAVLALPTTLLNLFVIAAILVSNLKREPCYKLLLNLAFTDLLAGLVTMPNLFVVFSYVAQLKDPCNFAFITVPLGYILSYASFLTIVLIARERYINIFRPYLQSTTINSKTIKYSVSSLWLLSVSFVILPVITNGFAVLNLLTFSVVILGTLLNTYCYLRILLQARKVRRQIESVAARFGQQRIATKNRSLVFIGGLIVISISTCYSLVVANSFRRILGGEKIAPDYALCWEWTLVMINSLINPVISCVFNPPLRRRIVNISYLRSSGHGNVSL